MARKPKITEDSLAKLGAQRLAALLAAEAGRNRQLKRDLELALEAETGHEGVAAHIRKRLAVIARSRSMLIDGKAEALIEELARLKGHILQDVAATAPDEALALLWQLIDLHGDTIERTHDGSGRIGGFFRQVCADLGAVAARVHPDPDNLAAQVFARVTANPYGVLDELVNVTAAGLGAEGLDSLRVRLLDARQRHLDSEGKAGSNQAGRYDHALSTFNLALRDVADCQGDVDAYIDAHTGRDPSNPAFAAEIAVRLANAGRAEEALAVLDPATPCQANRFFHEEEWTAARVLALDKAGRHKKAQELRWMAFERFLSTDHLRDYLRRLPDFEDVEAEERALGHVEQRAPFHSALMFLVAWPALARAARLVEQRPMEIDGDRYEILNPAASALEGKHPLAASLLRRATARSRCATARGAGAGADRSARDGPVTI